MYPDADPSAPAPPCLISQVEAFFRDDLPRLSDFQMRQAQVEMSREIARICQEGGQALIEAGTGIGKSLAYLVPLLLYQERLKGPSIIATKTVQLQEQLIGKTLPALQPLLPTPRTVVQAKGWSNYVCLRKIEQPDEPTVRRLGAQLEELRILAGDLGGRLTRQDSPLDARSWKQISADPMDCQKRNCPFFTRCGLFAERRELTKADIIVTNHAFLLTDLRLRREGRGLLPPGDILVVDEAHRLNDVATEQLAIRFDSERVHGAITSVLESGQSGWLEAVRFQFLMPLPEGDFMTWSDRFDRTVLMSLQDLDFLCRDLLTELTLAVSTQSNRLELTDLFNSEAGGYLDELLSALNLALEQSTEALTELCSEYEVRYGFAIPSELPRLAESFARLAADVDFLRSAEAQDWVFHAETTSPALVARPVDNAEALRTELFAEYHGVVLTSASLQVGPTFDFFKHAIGLEEPTLELSYPTPFEVVEHTFVGLVDSGKDPGDPNYPRELTPHLVELVVGLQGRTLLLTTSHRRVQEFAALMERELSIAGIELLVQGRDSPGRLLRRFASHGRHLLIGVDTFWEGVDIPGERLSCVVMTRLPFPVPSDALFKARAQRVERSGQNSFHHLSLPLVGLKLKQGFGRLLRSESDRGIFILTDPRACRRTYGRKLLENLPVEHAQRAALDEIVVQALAWSHTRFNEKL